jgi:hypothetical protein
VHKWKLGMEGITLIRPVCSRDCPNRSFDCHTRCETYIKYRQECDAEMEKRALERDVLGEFGDTSERIRKKRRERR